MFLFILYLDGYGNVFSLKLVLYFYWQKWYFLSLSSNAWLYFFALEPLKMNVDEVNKSESEEIEACDCFKKENRLKKSKGKYPYDFLHF